MALLLLCCATGIATAEASTKPWTLTLAGCGTQTITAAEFSAMKADRGTTFTDTDGNVYSGVPLTTLIGSVDDADTETFNTTRATEGYSIIIRATDWHDRIFSPSDLTDTGFCVADSVNGGPLPKQDGDIKIAPLILVGEDVPEGMGIGNIMDITLDGAAISGEKEEAVTVTILRYDEDGGTILNATTRDCRWMKEHLPIYGNGKTTYNYQGPTFDTTDLWNPTENKNPEKVWEIPMGTAIRDLCALVGGMQEGDELRMTATDGYVVELMYENIYTPKEKQGTAILAWQTKKEGFVPEYTGGPALFFLADDHVFGNQDMKECTDPGYWRFYWCSGTEYPSAAGLAVRNVEKLEIYPRAQADWELNLSGYLTSSTSKKEFEQGLACGKRAHGHLATHTDNDGHVWSGMPLYMLVGWVDDACQHDENLVNNKAYNMTLAENDAYTVILENADGKTVSFTSSEIMKSMDYIVVNQADGHTFSIDGDIWPLALRGKSVPADKEINGITTLTLDFDNSSSGSTEPDTTPAPFPWLAALAGASLTGFILRKRE
ncbi:hypothetical protein [Methanogenium sp. MK-MG]|uniref:hypothetical protein n=1 Tax=Methanogenium sp. MK-MG TaxID=2599926 RepID=UPI0013EA2870|nr:hypothetical protein [Methanogenium sp. MK-MG]KAF1074669.1 hypothetical protein MKMG_01910 [Methanogenium sp. MK-MG]